MITIVTAPAWDSGVNTAAAETADESASVTLGSRREHDDVNGGRSVVLNLYIAYNHHHRNKLNCVNHHPIDHHLYVRV